MVKAMKPAEYQAVIDTLAAEKAALIADRDFWKEQFQVETRYRIELADKGTLQALTDANNRMSSAEAERDELHDTVRMLKKALARLSAPKPTGEG